MEPIIFESKSNSDHRGTVSFTNDLNLNKVVRTYKVINKQARTVRAWHGHKIEEKWISVEGGEFLVCAVKVEDFENPSKDQEVFKFNMTPDSGILYIPKNYANGAMNLTENNAVRYYSSLPLEESIDDDYRFESDFEPKVLLLDEPFTGIDIPTQRKLEEYLRPLNQTVVLVSHVPETFENYERVIWIDEGGVQADGTPRGVIKKYQDAMYKYREKNI